MVTLAVLVKNMHQDQNRHMIGEIVEVQNMIILSEDGVPCYVTTKGYNKVIDGYNYHIPEYCLDITYCEILEVFDEYL